MRDRFIAFVLRRRWFVIGAASLVLAAAASGGRFLQVTGDYRAQLGEGNPDLAAFDRLEDTYAATYVALVAIAPRTGSVFDRETLLAVEQLTEAAWTLPHSARVDSLTNHFHSRAVGEDDLVVEPLVADAATLDEQELARIERIALGESELAGRLVSAEGRVAGVAISFARPEDQEAAWAEVRDAITPLLADAREQHPDLAYYLTGNVPLINTLAAAAQEDASVLSPLAFLLVMAATALLLRSLTGTLSLAVLVVFILATVVGIAGWLGVVFTPVSAVIPMIVITLAVAYSIHVVTSTLAAMNEGRTRNEAIAESLRTNLGPVFITAVTTAIGFLSLNFSESPPFHTLGNLAALGVLATFAYAVTLLPAMLSLLPLGASAVRAGGASLFDRLGAFVVRRWRLLLALVPLLVAALGLGVSRVELSDNWTRYFDDRYEFRRHTDFVIGNLTGLDRLEYSLESGSEGGITDPDYLRSVDAFAEWFRAQPEVVQVQAFPDLMKRLNRNLHGDDEAFHRLPEDPELAAQYLLLYEFSLPFGSDLNDRLDIAKSATRLTAVLGDSSSREQRQLESRAAEWLRQNAPELRGEATGLTVVFGQMSRRNINSMLTGTVVALILISCILIGIFRSPLLGAVSLIPNFIPALMSFGLWGYLVGRVGLASSVVAAIAFGMIVDDTVHFLSKYLKSRREGHSPTEAVRATFRAVGRALVTTTAVLSCGFLAFTLSGFETSWALGLLVTITLCFALLADFLLLPPLLIAVDRGARGALAPAGHPGDTPGTGSES